MLRSAAAYFAGIHIGVGFCVARSDGNGQCEGLRVSGRATGTDSRAFSVCKQSRGSRNLVGIAIQLSDSEQEKLLVGYSMLISPEKFDFGIE